MTMTLSAPQSVSWRNPLRRHAWYVVCLAVVACTWLTAALSPETERLSPHIRSLAWQPAVAGEAAPSDAWRPYDVGAGTDGGPVWVRAVFELRQAEADAQTAAVALGGAFSARAYLNGVEIGAKGEPGFTAAAEQPGRIDTALPLGSNVRAGTNELVLFVSAHHTHYRPEALFNAIEIQPQGGDGRRQLGAYGVAVSQVGVLLALVVAFAGLAWRRRTDAALPFAAAGAGLLLFAMAAETARVWWSYPYPYHVVRLSTVWLALSGFGIALIHATAVRFGARLRFGASAGAAAILLLTLAVAIPGIDDRARIGLIIMLAAAFTLVARRAAEGDTLARVLSLLFAVTATVLFVRGPEVIDNWIYVLGALMLAVFAWPVREAAPQPSMLALEDEEVDVADVVLVKAAGNYAEVHTATGRTHLVRKALTDLAPALPLMRVHRSYVVNLDRARRLVAKTGSRYALELDEGAPVPVSRKLADAVRAALARREEKRA